MDFSREHRTNPSVANPDLRFVNNGYERDPEAAFGDHIKQTGAICNSSASHTYGNVMSVVERYLVDTFPADTFKTIVTSTTLASRQVTSLPRQLMKKELPTMVLVPRISFGQDENRFLANTQLNARFTDTFATWGDGSLLPLADDRQRQLYVHGHYNRAVMFVDVILSFNSYMEQTDWMSYLHNFLPIQHNFFIRAPLELFIPGELCALISELAGLEIHDRDDASIHKFLTYMNSTWYDPITYKLKGSSNSDEFFMYYLTDIDTVIQEPQASPGVKDGQIRRNFDISFTVRCEFNTIGYFTLNSPRLNRPVRLSHRDGEVIVPFMTDMFDLDNFKLPTGWSVLAFPVFKLSVKDQERSVSIEPVLNASLRTVIDYHLRFGIPIERFLRVQFRENGKILADEGFYVDWVKREIVLTQPDYHRTYKLLITVSNAYVNELVKSIYDLE